MQIAGRVPREPTESDVHLQRLYILGRYFAKLLETHLRYARARDSYFPVRNMRKMLESSLRELKYTVICRCVGQECHLREFVRFSLKIVANFIFS